MTTTDAAPSILPTRIPSPVPWHIHKFGGSSLGNAKCIASACELALADSTENVAIVVSAMAGITDQLVAIRDRRAQERFVSPTDHELVELAALHAVVAKELLGESESQRYFPATGPSWAHLLGQGERWSAGLVHAYLRAQGHDAVLLIADEVLVVHGPHDDPIVDWAASRDRLAQFQNKHSGQLLVITGFIARRRDGSSTTLPRNGSDHSAAIFAKLLQAKSLTIWTDVDGVATADPHLVSDARTLPLLTYREARSLAVGGARVLHPSTLDPAEELGLPIRVRNSFAPQHPGTWITHGPNHALPAQHKPALTFVLLGPGMVGAEFLRQLHNCQASLEQRLDRQIKLVAVANSRFLTRDAQGLALADWRESLADTSLAHNDPDGLPHSHVVVDCTASTEIAARHHQWLACGVHVVTANKLGLGVGLRQAKQIMASRTAHYGHEATVCAGLPVLACLRDFVRTQDRVHRVEGILSGTMSHVFARLSAQVSFSAAFEEAKRLGYTEPDPRDDLGLQDVVRKALIIARTIGLDLETIAVEACHTDDEIWENRRATAESSGEVLRLVATIHHDGAVQIGVRSLPVNHPLAHVLPGDNAVSITSDRYATRPLVVQGPGAGAQVTAAAVLADFVDVLEKGSG